MTPTFEIDDDDGYFPLTVRSGDGSLVSGRLDLFKANNAYSAIATAHPDDPVAEGDAWVEWLATQGLPPVSHATAFKIADAIVERVTSLKKSSDNSSPSPASPGVTGPTPPPDCPRPDPSATSSSTP